MAYCTLADIKKSIPLSNIVELVDDTGDSSDNSVTTAMQAIIDFCIERADTEIDDYCRGRYTLPFSPIPTTIKDLSVDISVYRIYSRVRELESDHPRRVQYDDAIRKLRAINSGDVVLSTTPETDQADGRIVETNKVTADRIFSDTELAKF